MQEQSDFLKKLDEVGPTTPPPAPVPPLSPEQIELNRLREEIIKLEKQQDMCKVCNGESRGICHEEHTTPHLEVLRTQIEKLEESIA